VPGIVNRVFVSFTRADNDGALARTCATSLAKLGADVWYDETCVESGDAIVRRIDDGLASSGTIVLFATPNYFQRPWTRMEYEAAIYLKASDPSRRVFLVKAAPGTVIPPLAARLAYLTAAEPASIASEIYGLMDQDPTDSRLEAPSLTAEAIDLTELGDFEIASLARAVLNARPDFERQTGRRDVELVMDVSGSLTLAVSVVRCLAMDPLTSTLLKGELAVLHGQVQAVAAYRKGITGLALVDVPLLAAIAQAEELAARSIGTLRDSCRSLVRTAYRIPR